MKTGIFYLILILGQAFAFAANAQTAVTPADKTPVIQKKKTLSDLPKGCLEIVREEAKAIIDVRDSSKLDDSEKLLVYKEYSNTLSHAPKGSEVTLLPGEDVVLGILNDAIADSQNKLKNKKTTAQLLEEARAKMAEYKAKGATPEQITQITRDIDKLETQLTREAAVNAIAIQNVQAQLGPTNQASGGTNSVPAHTGNLTPH